MTSRNPLSRSVLLLAALAATPVLVAGPAPASAAASPVAPERSAVHQLAEPQVFGHRGASGYRPEHTLASYRLAIQLGADYIEPDLVSTKDGVLVARHENEISGTTDVADHPEFAVRRTTKTIDGRPVTGWFTEDFTLAELKTLRAQERLPQVRPDNTRYDGRFEVPTFAEVLALVKEQSRKAGRPVGVAPETKHPTYFDSIGLSLEEPMLRELKLAGLDKKRSKVLIQSFEVTNLRELDRRTDLPLEQLVDGSGAPYDQVVAGTGTTYRDLVTAAGLRRISSYAEWVGPTKDLVLPRDAAGATGAPSDLVDDAHAAGLRVVVFTLRDENQFMATNFRRGVDPNAKGDILAEVTAFLDAGVDGIFADFPDSAVEAREAWLD
ncbi:glycerophosphoryl diester phosphodiesterase [Nocardioides psychrotolerans]|uniref:glycerophosphodiester phosphodiesterase n=1 Tax=Nocardioides psychrotolerans TaxID=1005945 RepID=A0A1I3M0P4_9ACTN|nr:glycerophosphodiester phosphodiesterase [Nocardioides psychrotolerans]GEP38983.1 glycerophosphoryl diester phosphodiesterase [Nocardioides psychrotolerans]SFI90538.1 glycerophosphoryl diester phosphodiesterase [Nocardioides psychrotolerans]